MYSFEHADKGFHIRKSGRESAVGQSDIRCEKHLSGMVHTYVIQVGIIVDPDSFFEES